MFDRLRTTGYIDPPFDPRDVWEDEVLGGEVEIPKAYKIEGLYYEPQGAYPFCVSFACTTAAENKYGKAGALLSQAHLFFHAGGSPEGSNFRKNLDILRELGAVPYEKMPMPDVSVGRGSDWFERLKPQALSVPFEDTTKIPGYVRIDGFDREKLKAAVIKYGPLLVGVSTKGDYYKGYAKRVSNNNNHAVLLVGWDERDNWIIFDSLWWVKKSGGYAFLDSSYFFHSVYGITDLPEDWKEQRDKTRLEPFEKDYGVLDHYGMPRRLRDEQDSAQEMLREFKKFNNQSVLEAAGRFWTIYINAVTYGGYNVSYRKWGKWMPGDIINDCYHWRRTGEHIFDFNKQRKEYN